MWEGLVLGGFGSFRFLVTTACTTYSANRRDSAARLGSGIAKGRSFEAVALPREDHSEPAAEPAESIVESEPLPQIEEQVVIPENVMPIPPRVQRARKVPAYLKDYVTNFKGPKGKQ